MKNFLREKWFIICYFVFLLVSFLFVWNSTTGQEDNQFKHYSQIAFENPWEYEFSDGTKGTTELPAQLTAGKSNILLLTNVLPEVKDGQVLMFRSRHTMVKMYVDGELVYDQVEAGGGNGEETWFPLPGNIWNELIMKEEYSGCTIVIESSGMNQKYLQGPGSVYLGERGTFLMEIIKSRAGTLVGAVILFLLSVILLGLWFILTIASRKGYKQIMCLALFTLTVSLWEFTEIRCLQIFSVNMRAYSVLAYEILMLVPVPIAMYFLYGKRRRTVFLSKIATIIPLVVWVINNALHFLRICDLGETLIVTQVMIGFETVFAGYIQISDIIMDAKSNGNESGGVFWRVPLYGLSIMIPMLLLEVGRYIMGKSSSDEGILATIGVVGYILSLAFYSGLKLVSENFKVTQISESKSQFLANMSHEIRTPLNAILGFDEMILRDPQSDAVQEYAVKIQEAGASLRDIINTILDLSKIESGKMEIVEMEYDMVELLDNVIHIVSVLAEQKGLKLILDIDENLPKKMIGDEVHIRQVLNNIMTNAVKYTKKGSVTFKVKIQQKEQERCKILFSVKDTGIGIREEDRTRLFEKFERLDYASNKNTEGTGLGMSIVVKLLTAMNSQIELESRYGKGSEFYFVLEQKFSGTDCIGAYEEHKDRTTTEQHEGRHFTAPDASVLVVDDVLLNLQVVCGLLKRTKVKTDTAESGMEALRKIQEHRYDVILMDHMMPGMDGIETTKTIREMAEEKGDTYYRDVPVLALSANAVLGMREKFINEGMQDFISKPVEGKQLEETLVKWLPEEKVVFVQNEGSGSASEAAMPDNSKPAWEFEIAGIENETAAKYFDSKESFLDGLRTYLQASESTAEKIRQYRAEDDLPNYTITVHGLKSSSKIVGAMGVSELARRLEGYGHAGESEKAWEGTDELLNEYQACVDAIRAIVGNDEGEMQMLSKEELKLRLKQIGEAAEAFDVDAVLNWEKEMEQMEAPEGYQLLWKKLKQAVSELAFGDMSKIVELMLKRE
jgi:signal transduction histidine kinase/CheY-like chemotaxis protein